MDLEEIGEMVWSGFIWHMTRQLADSCEQVNETVSR
jgi:hypothetical protein